MHPDEDHDGDPGDQHQKLWNLDHNILPIDATQILKTTPHIIITLPTRLSTTARTIPNFPASFPFSGREMA
ncbi:MAG: hypothetical protein KDA80_09620 [Planctomycetaceae bacterium]|nr:hypothetical protein [Planctomycetaceae bacterium]